MILLLAGRDERLAEFIPSPALDAVTPGAVVAQRAGVARFLDRLAVT